MIPHKNSQWNCSPRREKCTLEEMDQIESHRTGRMCINDGLSVIKNGVNVLVNTHNSRENNYNDEVDQMVASISRDKTYAPKDYYIKGKVNNRHNEHCINSTPKDAIYARNGSVINRSRKKYFYDDDNMQDNGLIENGGRNLSKTSDSMGANRQRFSSKDRSIGSGKRVKTEIINHS